jgi:hypothetical protein
VAFTRPKPPDLATVEKIEISADWWGGRNGIASSHTWILCKDGPCRGKVHYQNNACPGCPAGECGEYELPPEAFEECRALLKETKFLTMPAPVAPEIHTEHGPNGSSLSVHCGGWSNQVTVLTTAPEPAEYQKLYDFVTEGLEKRGKKVEWPAKDGPTAGKDTGR